MNQFEIHNGQPFCLHIEDANTLKEEFEHSALCQLSHLFTAAFYLTKDKGEAEDLVQETYLRAFRFFDKFQPGTNCRAWLLSILRRLFINRYQQKRREPDMVDWEKIDKFYESIVEQSEEIRNGNPEVFFFSQIIDQEVGDAVKALPEEYRSAIVLVDIEDLCYEEASKVPECRIGTVCSRVSRGRRMLQVALRDYAIKKGYTH